MTNTAWALFLKTCWRSLLIVSLVVAYAVQSLHPYSKAHDREYAKHDSKLCQVCDHLFGQVFLPAAKQEQPAPQIIKLAVTRLAAATHQYDEYSLNLSANRGPPSLFS